MASKRRFRTPNARDEILLISLSHLSHLLLEKGANAARSPLTHVEVVSPLTSPKEHDDVVVFTFVFVCCSRW